MGQEISQPRDKCSNNIGRRQQQHQQQSQHNNKHQYHQPNITNNNNNNNEKYTKRNSSTSTTTLTSSNNSSEDELHRKQLQLELQLQQQQQHLRQKYNTPKQQNNSRPISYEKQKLTKKLSLISNISSTSDYQSTSVSSIATSSPTHSLLYDKLQKPQHHQRKNSQSTDSGIYYTSCHCSTSSAASSCGSTAGSAISSSNKSLDKTKNYLNHHLYIKSYLDILEEDEKARAHFKPARPGIRNYTPKILSDSSAATTLTSASTSAPSVSSTQTNSNLRSSSSSSSTSTKGKEDPWI